MPRKKSVKKGGNEASCGSYWDCKSSWVLMKIGIIACVLFLMTVWKGLGVTLLNVHWGIYLGIVLLVIIFSMTGHSRRK